MLDLAIIIVNWNVRDMLAACLRTVQADLAASDLAGQMWVVDNASTDGSVEMLRRDFPDVCLIASEENLGFAGGNNAALRALGFPDEQPTEQLPRYVLLLNPDTEVHTGALAALVRFLDGRPQAGIAGARLFFGDGSFQHGAFALPGLAQLAIELLPVPGRLIESRLNGRYPLELYKGDTPFEIGHPLGAAMCVRREAIQQVGMLDEAYHMYVEEVDWSKRITAAGWRAYCVPTAHVTHFGGQSTGQIKTTSFVNLWTSRHRFYQKHYQPLTRWLARLIVKRGMQRNAERDTRLHQRGELAQPELIARLQAYQQVIKLWGEV